MGTHDKELRHYIAQETAGFETFLYDRAMDFTGWRSPNVHGAGEIDC